MLASALIASPIAISSKALLTGGLLNLLLPLLLDVASAGFDQEPPQLMIASGLLIEQVDEVAKAFADAHGLLEVDRRISGDWGALLLAQPN